MTKNAGFVHSETTLRDAEGRERCVRDAWVETELADGWCSAFRIRVRSGVPTVVEVRVFPARQHDEVDGFPLTAGQWEAEVLGIGASGPEGALSARLLRRLRFETAISESAERIARLGAGGRQLQDRSPNVGFDRLRREAARRPGPRGRPDSFYAELAWAYVQFIGTPQPVETLSALIDRPASHVRQLLATARERGLLSAAPRGRAGGELTPKAEALLAEADNERGGPMPTTEIEGLDSHDEIAQFVAAGYRETSQGVKLPLAVSEPGPLIERAVQLSGPDGMTLQEVRALFRQLGAERLERGIAWARSTSVLTETRERRPNRSGRLQEQVVFRARAGD